MAKKNNEVKENEELKENVVEEITGTTEKVEEIETFDAEDAKVEENASKNEQDAQVQVIEKITVKEIFRDKYNDKVIYNPGDIFVESEDVKDKKPVEVEKGKYAVSKERYAELQRSLYTD